MKVLGKYRNGNYNVIIFDDGTKVRTNDLDFFKAEAPESMDIKITNKCDMGCKFCLDSSSKLNVEGENKSISSIQVGDRVLSYNIEKQCVEYQPVVKTYQRPFKGKMFIIIDEFNNRLMCTPNHKVYTLNRGYVRADELTNNDLLVVE